MDCLKMELTALVDFCAAIFGKSGVPAEAAHLQADVLAAADARGIPSHGVARLPRYVAGLATGQMLPEAEPRKIRETPTSLLMDAAGGLGAPVSVAAMDAVLDKAEESGMAFAAVRNSNHFGIAAYYAMRALDRDMIGIAMTNTAALGVPTFGRHVAFGTNPLAFAAPASSERHFVLDMSTTVVTRGKIEVYDREGKTLPPGWAVDKEGLSARDPKSLLLDMFHRYGGGIVPLGGDSERNGGHKGFGLAVMVDILTGLLSGGGYGTDVMDTELSSAHVSHCFGAMRIDLFQEPGLFKSQMDRMLKGLRTAQPAMGAERVYYAGLKEWEAQDKARLEGVPLDRGVIDILRNLGDKHGVTLPPCFA